MAFPVAAAIGAGASLIGSGLNFGSAKKNREMQIQLNRENNEFNAQQAEIQRNWTERMYTDYQSPQAMRSQYEEAGMNPYLAMSGSAGSVGSGSSASASGTPNLQAPQLDVSTLGSTFASVAQAIKLSKEASEVAPNALANRNYLAALAAKAEGDTDFFSRTLKDFKFTPEDRSLLVDYRRAYYRGEIDRINLSNDILAQQKINYNLDAKTKQLLNKWYPEQQQADIALKAAQISDALSQVDFRKLQGESERARAKVLVAQAAQAYAAMEDLLESASGRRISNAVQRRTMEGLISAIDSDNRLKAMDNRYVARHFNQIKEMWLSSLKYSNEEQRKSALWFLARVFFSGVGSSGVSAAIGSLGRTSGQSPNVGSRGVSYSGWNTSY